MDDEMGIFSILAVPLGYIMRWLYMLVGNYGWAIILFTLLTRILMFPLTLKQQKSTARMSAYQPMIQEIQKKWANDKNRQQQEMQKFYEENNVKMNPGCLPMIVNMLVMFGIIAVIQAPLDHILKVDVEQINTGIAIVQTYDRDSKVGDPGETYTRQSRLIGEIRANPDVFTTGAEVPMVDGAVYVLQPGEYFKDGKIYSSKDEVVKESATMQHAAMDAGVVHDIDIFHFQFMGLNLADAPALDDWVTLILPVLSMLTMLGSQVVVMRTSGSGGQQQSKAQMWIMTLVFGVMFGFFAFRVPNGFSLYYTISNVVMTVQQIIVRKIHDPEKIREEIMADIEERRAAKKGKKKVIVQEGDGEEVSRELTEAELTKLRLARARALDAQRYGEDGDEAQEAQSDAAEKARKLDEARYGKDSKPAQSDEAGEPAALPAGEQAEAGPAAEVAESVNEAPQGDEKEYKPGRRKRARQKKEPDGFFAQQERASERQAENKEADNNG